MYSRMLVPLDESKLAEQVLPYARYLAKALSIPVELLEVVDPEALHLLANPKQCALRRHRSWLIRSKRQKLFGDHRRIVSENTGYVFRGNWQGGRIDHRQRCC